MPQLKQGAPLAAVYTLGVGVDQVDPYNCGLGRIREARGENAIPLDKAAIDAINERVAKSYITRVDAFSGCLKDMLHDLRTK